MHRDQKIGLSFAVLLIGFAAAFCFRNDPLSDPQPLALDRAAALDARIEQLPIRAYTQREGSGGLFRESDLLDPAAEIIDASLVERPAEPILGEPAVSGDVVDLFAGPPEPVRTVGVQLEVPTADQQVERERPQVDPSADLVQAATARPLELTEGRHESPAKSPPSRHLPLRRRRPCEPTSSSRETR